MYFNVFGYIEYYKPIFFLAVIGLSSTRVLSCTFWEGYPRIQSLAVDIYPLETARKQRYLADTLLRSAMLLAFLLSSNLWRNIWETLRSDRHQELFYIMNSQPFFVSFITFTLKNCSTPPLYSIYS